jgi:RNA polymerase sigma-70 factor (ECF subfamily)
MLEDVSRFAPWIFRIAHNETYSLLRKRRPEIDADEGLPPDRPTPREYPVEMSLAAAAALDRLTADHREAVVLKVYQGFKFEEISEILDVPVSTVKSRLYTALDLLKSELSPAAGNITKGRSFS